MSNPIITFNVDTTNPGQYFACCGLLELADRMWPGAEGWFENETFRLSCEGDLEGILQWLANKSPEALTSLANGITVKPLIAPLRLVMPNGSGLTLNAWMAVALEKGEGVAVANPPWNFWSGQQTSQIIWTALQRVLVEQLRSLHREEHENLFRLRQFQKGRFGFDPGPAWNALDTGFSPNEQGLEVESSAAVELLAAVGVQRFVPDIAPGRNSFVYATWGQPLAPTVAAAAAADRLHVKEYSRFRAPVVRRGSYAALGHSIPLTGDSHD